MWMHFLYVISLVALGETGKQVFLPHSMKHERFCCSFHLLGFRSFWLLFQQGNWCVSREKERENKAKQNKRYDGWRWDNKQIVCVKQTTNNDANRQINSNFWWKSGRLHRTILIICHKSINSSTFVSSRLYFIQAKHLNTKRKTWESKAKTKKNRDCRRFGGFFG